MCGTFIFRIYNLQGLMLKYQAIYFSFNHFYHLYNFINCPFSLLLSLFLIFDIFFLQILIITRLGIFSVNKMFMLYSSRFTFLVIEDGPSLLRCFVSRSFFFLTPPALKPQAFRRFSLDVWKKNFQSFISLLCLRCLFRFW